MSAQDPLLKDWTKLRDHLVKLALESYDEADPGHDWSERVHFEKDTTERMTKVAHLLTLEHKFALERAQHRPYQRGLKRLVGNARCNECGTFKPANTAFSPDPKDGSCAFLICDDCLRAVLPK